jgi:poly(A) polymerase/tRNA nucleotidyltransferase (CCA-adding enzyme)
MRKALNKLNFLTDLVAVGGCVRDHLLGRESDDVDLATADEPEEVVRKCRERDFHVVTDVGIEHGTVLVFVDGQEYEVTTFRKDLDCDGRHAEVAFTTDLKTDLERRDFTINAMAMDADGNVRDPFNGQTDLERGLIRAVGKPEKRFEEDLLRVLRGARFAARYDFDVEPDTREAMEKMAPRVLDNVSVERVRAEFDKAFKDEKPSRFLRRMYGLELLQELMPEFEGMDELQQNPEHHPEGDVFSHICNVVDRAPADPKDRWAALLHDIGKTPTAEKVPGEDYCRFHGHAQAGAEIVKRVAEDLKFSNDFTERLYVLTRNHMTPLHVENQDSEVDDGQVRRFQNKMGEHLEAFRRLVEADHGRGDSPLFREVEEPTQPVLMGRHLIDRGHEPGPHFGDALDAAFEVQLDDGVTDKDKLYEVAKPHLND